MIGRISAHGAHQVGPQRRGGRSSAAQLRVLQLVPLLGMAHQVVGQRLAGTQHRQQPHRGALIGTQRLEQVSPAAAPRGSGLALGSRLVQRRQEQRQRLQRLVRVGGPTHQGKQFDRSLADRGQVVAAGGHVTHARTNQGSGGDLPHPDQTTGSIWSRSKAETWPR